MTASPEHAGIHAALLAFQADAPTLQKTKINPAFGKSKYVGLDHLVAEITPLLTTHGLIWATLPTSREGEPALEYRLIHAASGEHISGTMLLRSKGTPQDQGSALTYARRYSMMSVLNLVGSEDDDGQRASRPPRAAATPAKLSADKRAKVVKAIVDAGMNPALVYASVNLANVGEMTAQHAREIRVILDKPA